jgi:hypothetical protein
MVEPIHSDSNSKFNMSIDLSLIIFLVVMDDVFMDSEVLFIYTC